MIHMCMPLGQASGRPEVRAEFQDEVPLSGAKISEYTVKRPGAWQFFRSNSKSPAPRKGTECPGEAILKGSNSWKLMHLCSVLFGSVP